MKTFAESCNEVFSSTLYLLLPGSDCPTPESIRSTLSEWDWELQEEEIPPLEGTEWAKAWGTDETIFLVSAIKADGTLFDLIRFREARCDDEATRKAAEKAQWILRIETQWDIHYPMDSFRQQIQFCAAMAISRKAPLFDFNSMHLYTPDEVYEMAFSRVPPRSTQIYVIHDLYPSEGPDNDGHWLHTHGLNRAGLPELELLNVPARYVGAAGDLIIAAVDLLLGGGQPPLRKTIQLGKELKVAMLEWERFVFPLPLEVVGGMQSRALDSGEEDLMHTGYRAAVVSQKPKGFFKKKWTLPVTVLSAIAKGDEEIFWKSPAEFERNKAVAHEKWDLFPQLYRGRRADWKFFVKLGRPADSAGTRHEYLWFEVLELERERVRGVLRSRPEAAKKTKPSEEGWYPLDKLADWRIQTSEGEFTPENAEPLLAKAEIRPEPEPVHSDSPFNEEIGDGAYEGLDDDEDDGEGDDGGEDESAGEPTSEPA